MRISDWSSDVCSSDLVAAEQRLGRAHLRAERQLALGQAVAAVLLELGVRVVFLGTASTEGALVHLAAAAEVARLRILRCAKRAGIEAVAAEHGRASCRERVCQ